MFTLIQNYRKLFMMCMANNMAEQLTPAVDADGDGDLDMIDINRFSPETQAAIRRVLGETNMNTLESGRAFSIQSLIEHGFIVERDGAIDETRSLQRDHRETVETGVDILSGSRLTRAVNYINRMDAGQRNSLATVLPGRQENAADLAQAVARFQAANGLTVDGQPGRNTITALNAQTRASGVREETEVGAEAVTQINYPPQGRAATEALQQLIGTNPDGAFGPASRRALQTFLQSRGFYNGPIDGDIGRGSRAAIAAYNAGRTASGEVTSATVNTLPRNAIERFFGIGDREAMRARLDQFIGASDTELISLGHEAGAAKISGDRNEINRVYNRIMAELQSRNLPREVYNAFIVRSQRDKMIVLDYFENALMGSSSSERVARGLAGSEEYLANSDRVLAEAAGVLSEYSFRDHSLSSVRYLRQHMTGHLDSVALREGVYFVVRTQGDQARLSPFTHGQEALMINGANMWDVRENRADVLRLISQMSTNQLTYIRRQVSYGGTLTRERLAELVEDGIVTFDVQMYLAENCSNLSYRLVPSGRVPSHEGGDGGNDGSPDSSDPGVRGGGDVGGGLGGGSGVTR